MHTRSCGILCQLTRWIASSVAVTSSVEVVLVASATSIDIPLADHGASVVVIAVEQGVARTNHRWETADVHTSSTGARYCTRAGTCTAGRGKKIVISDPIVC